MKRLLYAVVMMTSSTMFAQSSESVEAYILNMNLTNFKSNTTSNDYSFLGSNTTNKTVFLKEKITYSDHVFEASSFEVPLITDYFHMDALVAENKLVSVPEDTDFYVIQKLTHSRAFLIKPAFDALNEISSKFKSETNTRLSISSLARTLETQRKLRRVNSNAAKGASAHEYGAAFDISYSQYDDGVRGRNYSYESKLQAILDQMVAEGKIYYIKERRQPCFHITVRNPGLIYPEMMIESEHEHNI